MGQEESTLVDESVPPETLTERSLSAVAEYIKNGQARRIVVLTGAGISTAAGSKWHYIFYVFFFFPKFFFLIEANLTSC